MRRLCFSQSDSKHCFNGSPNMIQLKHRDYDERIAEVQSG